MPDTPQQTLVDRMDALQGASSNGLEGREAIEAAMGAIRVEVDALPELNGMQMIAVERHRQLTELGYTAEFDMMHAVSELELAAIAYACPPEVKDGNGKNIRQRLLRLWPFKGDTLANVKGRMESPRIRQLQKAGALIAAAIDRHISEEKPRYAAKHVTPAAVEEVTT
jgi:hypothetical protein